MSTDKNSNGIPKAGFGEEKIEFPITFQLKAVMVETSDDENNKGKLVEIFKKLNISNNYIDKKVSSKGSYVSYTYEITVKDKLQMDTMYADLKKIKELKFAV